MKKQKKYDTAYMKMALEWAKLSHCKRKQVGALIVKNRMIISDGYNGTPSGFDNCCEDGEGNTHWHVLHAEANAILKVAGLKRKNFKGKANRLQFWWFLIFVVSGIIISSIIDKLIFGANFISPNSSTGWIGIIWDLFILIPTLSIGARRLHDTKRSGWWQLLLLIIIIGWVVLFIWWSQESYENDPEKKPIGIPQ